MSSWRLHQKETGKPGRTIGLGRSGEIKGSTLSFSFSHSPLENTTLTSWDLGPLPGIQVLPSLPLLPLNLVALLELSYGLIHHDARLKGRSRVRSLPANSLVLYLILNFLTWRVTLN